MQEYLKKLPKEIQDLIHSASLISFANNLPAYLVGGFVRDLILGVKNFDIDIVVEYDGIKFAEDFANTLKAKLIRHRRFGTATIILENGLKVDIATIRKEYYPHPASLPNVVSGTLKDDLFRRDFTINAMALSIERKDFGRLVDFFGGRSDLAKKKIRIMHSVSFIDDPTRILRAIRFEKRYDFKIEPLSAGYLKEAVALKMLQKVQPQRLRDELILILKERAPIKQVKRIQELAGFSFISCHLHISKETYRLLDGIKDELAWFSKKFPRHRQLDSWLIFLMGLADSLDAEGLRLMCRKFAFRKGEETRLVSVKRIDKKFIQELSISALKPSKVFALLEPLSYEAMLFLKAKYRNRNFRKYIEDFFSVYNGMRLNISGHDLGRIGIVPGPEYQKIFSRVLNAKLDGEVKTKEQELGLIKRLYWRSEGC